MPKLVEIGSVVPEKKLKSYLGKRCMTDKNG
jgi:hypothetical protein